MGMALIRDQLSITIAINDDCHGSALFPVVADSQDKPSKPSASSVPIAFTRTYLLEVLETVDRRSANCGKRGN